jgi:hypothetical protein
VIRAEELGGVALVVAAHLHAAVPARVQEHVEARGTVAAEDDRLLAHGRDHEVARARHLALVPDEEPRAREDLLLLAPVDLLIDEDLAADRAAIDVDEAVEAAGVQVRHGAATIPPPGRPGKRVLTPLGPA